jgi:hypothetical protein
MTAFPATQDVEKGIAPTRARRARRRLAALICGTAAVAFLAPASAGAALSVQDFDHGASPDGLAQQLAGQGVSISNVQYTGANRLAGTFSGGDGIIGFGSGIILDSGFVQTLPGEEGSCQQGVEGPNDCSEAGPGSDNSNGLGLPGDDELTALSTANGGGATEDASVLQFDFVPAGSQVTFSYVFSSEEYNNYSNTSFNDVFAFFVNGTNCATVPGTGGPVSINTINNGNPGGDTTPHNPQFYVDNVRPTPTLDTQMDGLTTVLTCNATVNAGQSNHMKLAIADASDDSLDSAVFLQAGSLSSPPSGLTFQITGRKKQKPVGPQVAPANHKAKNNPGKILSVKVTCQNSPCTVNLKGTATSPGQKVKFKGPKISLQSGETKKVRLSATGKAPLASLKAALKSGANGKAKVHGTATAPNGEKVTDNFNVKLRGR